MRVQGFAKTASVMRCKRAGRCSFRYLEVISGIGIFITGNDLGGHPVRRSNEGVSPAHRSVQLSADTKIHCGSEREQGIIVRLGTNLSNALLLTARHLSSFGTTPLCGQERRTRPETLLFDLCQDQQRSTKDEPDHLMSRFCTKPCAFSSLPGGNEKKSQLLTLTRNRVSNMNKQQPLFYALSTELKPAKH